MPALDKPARRGIRFEAPGRRSAMGNVHLLPRGDIWTLEVDGAKFWSFETEDEALRRGRRLAQRERGELVVHGNDGTIREKDSHGHDPRDIPG